MQADYVLNKIGSGIASLGAAYSLQQLGKRIMDVRSEFQQLEVAFSTMLQSKSRANELMAQLTQTAATTTFQLQEVAGGAKQLLAYGTSVDKVNDTLIHLGDIAAGMSLPLNDLIYLYGTTMVQGKMMTVDLKQFQGRGIPIAKALANEFGVAQDEVAGLVSAGEVTAERFNNAIMSMSSAGGQFGGLMEAKSQTIGGQISNIKDQIDMMFNNIGKSSEGLINTGLSSVSFLIEHYEAFGGTLLTLVSAFGAYRAALMVTSAVENLRAKQNLSIEAQKEASINAAINQALNTNTASRETNVSAIQQQIIATREKLQADVAESNMAYDSAQKAVGGAQMKLFWAEREVIAKEKQYQATLLTGNGEAIEAAENAFNTAIVERNSLAREHNVAVKNLETATTTKNATTTRLSTFNTAVDTATKQANTAATGVWAAVTRGATAAWNGLKVAMATNPIGMALMAVTTIIGLLVTFSSSTEEVSSEMDKLREATGESMGKLQGFQATLSVTKQGSEAYKSAIEGINDLCKEHNVALLDENRTLAEQKERVEELTRAIQAQAAQKLLSEASSDAAKKMMESEKEAMNALIEQASDATYDGATIMTTTGAYTTELVSSNLRNITNATWGAVSTEVMSHVDELRAAYAKSEADGEKAVQNVAEKVRTMLSSVGVTDVELNAFMGNVVTYVGAVGSGASDVYSELDRANYQLAGLASQAQDTADTAQKSFDEMNFDELIAEEERVQNEMDKINNKTITPKVDFTNLKTLQTQLREIRKAMSLASDDDIEEALKEAKAKRSRAKFGSKEWKERDKEVERLIREQNKRKDRSAEGRIQKEKKKKKKKTYDPKQAEYEIAEADKDIKKKWDAIVKKWTDEMVEEELSARKDGHEKVMAQLKKEREEKLKALEEEINAQVEVLKKRDLNAWKKRNPKKKKEYQYQQTKTDVEYREQVLSGKIGATYESRKSSLNDAYEKKMATEVQKEKEAQDSALRQFEISYGSYLEKRKAIQADAKAKMSKAQTEGEKKTIKAETKKQLEELDFKEMQGAMDWEAVFSDLGVQATAQLEAMEQQLRSIIEANKDLSPEKMKTLVDALSNIRTEVASRNPFKAISDSLKKIGQHKRSVDTLQRSLDVYSTSIGAVYRVAEENGDALVMATEGNKEVTIEYIDAEGKAVTATMKYADALKMLKKEQKDLTNSQRTLSNGIKGVGSKLGEVAQIGNSFKGLADELGINVPEGLSKAFEGMEKAGQAMESLDVTKPGSFLNINNYLNMATGVVMQLKGIGELIFGGADTKRYDEMKEKYDALIEVWDTLIDRKLEYLNQAEGQEITRTAKEAKSLVEEQMKAYRRLGSEYLNSGSGTFSSSKGKKLRKKMNSEDWADVKKVLGTTDLGGRLEKLFDLSVDKLKALQEGATSFWSKLDEQTKEYLNNVIEGEKSLQDIIDQQRESITGVSFDGFYDSFLSTLSDMDSAVSDFADDIEGYLQKAILSSWVGQTLKKRLETLYTQFALSGEDGTITKEEASVLSAEYARIAKEAVAYRNSLKETFGWGSSGSDSSSSKGFETMTQDTATELNGRFTAMNIRLEAILQQAMQIGSAMASRVTQVLEVNAMMREMLVLQAKGNSHLEDISAHTKPLTSLLEQLNNRIQKLL